VTQDPLKAGEVALLYLAIQQIEGNTLVPLVMQRAVGLNPLAVIVALLLGGALLGVLGAVLAVPAAAAVQVLVLRVLAPLARRASAAERGPGEGEQRPALPH
jgi:predicted PurR-regulated permease PerM